MCSLTPTPPAAPGRCNNITSAEQMCLFGKPSPTGSPPRTYTWWGWGGAVKIQAPTLPLAGRCWQAASHFYTFSTWTFHSFSPVLCSLSQALRFQEETFYHYLNDTQQAQEQARGGSKSKRGSSYASPLPGLQQNLAGVKRSTRKLGKTEQLDFSCFIWYKLFLQCTKCF